MTPFPCLDPCYHHKGEVMHHPTQRGHGCPGQPRGIRQRIRTGLRLGFCQDLGCLRKWDSALDRLSGSGASSAIGCLIKINAVCKGAASMEVTQERGSRWFRPRRTCLF